MPHAEAAASGVLPAIARVWASSERSVQLVDGKTGEQGNTPFHQMEDFANDLPRLVRIGHVGCGIRRGPLRKHWRPRPYRAHLACGPVADGYDEIHVRRVLERKFVPRFAPRTLRADTALAQKLEDEGIHAAAWMTAGAERFEATLAFRVQHAFGDDAAGRIPRAQEQDVINTLASACLVFTGSPP